MNITLKEHPSYIELLEDKETYDARQAEIKEKREQERKRLREEDPEAGLDWFLRGTTSEMVKNLTKITNERDRNRLIARNG